MEKKKTLGRRKIEMKKIEKKSTLQVTFSKRRIGLFKKASELSVLCGCDIGILVQSPAEKMYAFGHPSVDSTLHRVQGNDSLHMMNSWWCNNGKDSSSSSSSSRLEYAEVFDKLQMEKKLSNTNHENVSWFDSPIEGMELDELTEYLEGLNYLYENVERRVAESNKNNNVEIVGGVSNNIDTATTTMMTMMEPHCSSLESSGSSFPPPSLLMDDDHLPPPLLQCADDDEDIEDMINSLLDLDGLDDFDLSQFLP